MGNRFPEPIQKSDYFVLKIRFSEVNEKNNRIFHHRKICSLDRTRWVDVFRGQDRFKKWKIRPTDIVDT